ncbi:kinase-like protein [Desarmillaria tabescens]|uniref:Kinase-like protein n=1 Tax=Armillaria tabescens TaxID=1929756 RepID=A0AA39NLU1_ARMTA|nr:kinase-like protein [Desarmillaria tabescens]KAK0468018.1 kinase-like protein [Desarmillaria tabescens]
MQRFLCRLLSRLCPFFPLSLRIRLWLYLQGVGVRKWGRSVGAQVLPFGLYMKQRPISAEYVEDKVLQFVSTHTSIPVPELVDSFQHDGRQVIIIQGLPGNDLFDITKVATQLTSYLCQLRAIPLPHPPSISGFASKSIRDTRLSLSNHPVTSFDTVAEFHKFFIACQFLEIPPQDEESVRKLITTAHEKPHSIVFTHNDLHPCNILVDRHLKITGIIDWEQAGWMPEYWEYTKACFVPIFNGSRSRWPVIMREVFPQYEDELKAEKALVRYRTVYN